MLLGVSSSWIMVCLNVASICLLDGFGLLELSIDSEQTDVISFMFSF